MNVSFKLKCMYGMYVWLNTINFHGMHVDTSLISIDGMHVFNI